MGYDYDIFMSYTRDDLVSDWVRVTFLPLFEKHLRISLGKDPKIFIDKKNIKGGESWPNKLKKALATSKLLVSICSPYYFKRDWCIYEYKVMSFREQQLKLKSIENPQGLIIPINIQDGEFFPSEVRHTEWHYFHDFLLEGLRLGTNTYEEFEKKIKVVVAEVSTILRDDNFVPNWDNSWLQKGYFNKAISEIKLTESTIEIPNPTM